MSSKVFTRERGEGREEYLKAEEGDRGGLLFSAIIDAAITGKPSTSEKLSEMAAVSTDSFSKH